MKKTPKKQEDPLKLLKTSGKLSYCGVGGGMKCELTITKYDEGSTGGRRGRTGGSGESPRKCLPLVTARESPFGCLNLWGERRKKHPRDINTKTDKSQTGGGMGKSSKSV